MSGSAENEPERTPAGEHGMDEAYHVKVFDNFNPGDWPDETWVVGTYSTAEAAIEALKAGGSIPPSGSTPPRDFAKRGSG